MIFRVRHIESKTWTEVPANFPSEAAQKYAALMEWAGPREGQLCAAVVVELDGDVTHWIVNRLESYYVRPG